MQMINNSKCKDLMCSSRLSFTEDNVGVGEIRGKNKVVFLWDAHNAP